MVLEFAFQGRPAELPGLAGALHQRALGVVLPP